MAKTVPAIRLLVLASAVPHVENYVEVTNTAAALGERIEIRAVTLEKWYFRGAMSAFKRYGFEVHDMPRPSCSNLSYWCEEGIAKEVALAFPAVQEYFQNILVSFRPHVFLTCGDDGKFEAAFLMACRRYGIPSVLIAEIPVLSADSSSRSDANKELLWLDRISSGERKSGFSDVRKLRLIWLMDRLDAKIRFAIERSPWGSMPRVRALGLNGATAIAVSGYKCFDRLCAQGVRRSRLVVTGWPRFDRLFRFVKKHMAECIDEKKWEEGKIKVLYADSGYGLFGNDDTGKILLEYVLEASRILENRVQIGIRFKPGVGLEHYSGTWPKAKGSLRILDSSSDLYEQLKDTDIVIGDNSAVQAEAMMMGIPAVNIMKSRSDDWKEFVRSGSAIPALNGRELAEAILKIAGSAELRKQISVAQKDYLFPWYHHFDGRAGERVLKLAMKLSGLAETL